MNPEGNPSCESILMPPEKTEEGLVTMLRNDRQRIVAWASRTDPTSNREGRALAVEHEKCLPCALALPAAAISAGLAGLIGDGEIAVGGIFGALASQLLPAAATTRPVGNADRGNADWVVAASENVGSWPALMAKLRPEGTFVALTGPHLQPVVYDFYPHVHARSLRMSLVPWYLPPVAPRQLFASLHEAATMASALVDTSGAELSAWRWLVGAKDVLAQ